MNSLDPFYKAYKVLLETVSGGKKAVMVTDLKNSHKTVVPYDDLDKDNQRKIGEMTEGFIKFLPEKAMLLELLVPDPDLVVFGGGHVAASLVDMAGKAGFSVTVVDDRIEFANEKRFPAANKVVCCDFNECFKEVKVDGFTYAVIMTRGHKHDLLCLENVLAAKPTYIGMMASKDRAETAKGSLLQKGYPQSLVEKINSPIGLPINAVTPVEIGISILSQLIAVRRLQGAGESQTEILRKLTYEEPKRPVALVTIVGEKGSTPRGVGAKMLVFKDGSIAGSVGGGWSEAQVVKRARQLLLSEKSGFEVLQLTITGDIAEEDGIGCCGAIETLIEIVG